MDIQLKTNDNQSDCPRNCKCDKQEVRCSNWSFRGDVTLPESAEVL